MSKKMGSFVVDSSRHAYYNKICLACPDKTRVGDVVLIIDQDMGFVYRELVIHKRCILATLVDSPADKTEITDFFDGLRASFAATGMSPIEARLSA